MLVTPGSKRIKDQSNSLTLTMFISAKCVTQRTSESCNEWPFVVKCSVMEKTGIFEINVNNENAGVMTNIFHTNPLTFHPLMKGETWTVWIFF